MTEFFRGLRFLRACPEDAGFYSALYGMSLRSVFVDAVGSYATWWSSSALSDHLLHEWMVDRLALYLVGEHPFVYPPNPSGRSVPDLSVRGFVIEVETGLKSSFVAMERRLRRFSAFVYVVVPNPEVAFRYRRRLGRFHGRVQTVKEFEMFFYSQQ